MTFLDTVDGKLARVTVTSTRLGNIFDHGIDLVHPPLWYLAWGIGLALEPPAIGGVPLSLLFGVILAGYIGGRLCEGAFQLLDRAVLDLHVASVRLLVPADRGAAQSEHDHAHREPRSPAGRTWGCWRSPRGPRCRRRCCSCGCCWPRTRSAPGTPSASWLSEIGADGGRAVAGGARLRPRRTRRAQGLTGCRVMPALIRRTPDAARGCDAAHRRSAQSPQRGESQGRRDPMRRCSTPIRTSPAATCLDPASVTTALREMAERGVDTVAISGGDGTVNAVLNTVFGRSPFPRLPLLAVLRGGTANMTARDIGMQGRQDRALRALLELRRARRRRPRRGRASGHAHRPGRGTGAHLRDVLRRRRDLAGHRILQAGGARAGPARRDRTGGHDGALRHRDGPRRARHRRAGADHRRHRRGSARVLRLRDRPRHHARAAGPRAASLLGHGGRAAALRQRARGPAPLGQGAAGPPARPAQPLHHAGERV